MVVLAATALILSTAALAVAFFLWRRVRRLENQPARKSPSPSHLERGLFDSVELSLEAMLEELELKEREIIKRIERREQELWSSLSRAKDDGPQTGPPLGQSEIAGREDQAHPAETKEEEAVEERGTSHPPTAEDKHAAVLQLAAEGLDVVTIAKRLGLGKGEVALILKLGQST